ncbi:RPA-interacting protein, C-terminal domain [Phytophthora cinnamomi]|nr:RPA-interacting protein, C-terminal domain [Phytophthora cinnamomi]
MGEEFQLVMYDVYTTRQNLSPKSKSPVRPTLGATQTQSPTRSPRKTQKSPPPISQSQSLVLQLSSSSSVPVPPSSKKIPHQLKVTVLRKLLSEKRKTYSDDRDRGREAWAAARKQMRSEALRYDVLDELAAFKQLQAKYATFLLLHSITETELVRLIHQTQEEANAADSAASSPPPHAHRRSSRGVSGGPRKSHGHVDITTITG